MNKKLFLSIIVSVLIWICGGIGYIYIKDNTAENVFSESLILKNKNSNFSFYLLAIGTTILLACSTDSSKEKDQTNDTLAVILNGQGNELKKDDLSDKKENCKIDSILPDDFPLVGEIAINDTITQINGVRIFAEVMPEFGSSVVFAVTAVSIGVILLFSRQRHFRL